MWQQEDPMLYVPVNLDTFLNQLELSIQDKVKVHIAKAWKSLEWFERYCVRAFI